MSLTELIDLAGERVGGKALAANDEFFAPKESLLKLERPVFLEHKYTDRGKWMDGWETRRRRESGHDWCVLRLGLRGVVRGIDVDTSFFTGNYPEACSLEAADAKMTAGAASLLKDPAVWTEILPKSALKGGGSNLLAVRSLRPWTFLRLNIYPDGGVARLRVYGDVVPDWDKLKASGKPIDLAAVANGGLVLASSDMYFGKANNMLMPGRAANMGDGWETKRRRGPGHDWCLIKMGAPGLIEEIEVDTNHFKGNYPDSCHIEAVHAPRASAAELDTEGAAWFELLPKTKLAAHKRHFFKKLKTLQPCSHARLRIFPDGGVSRLRLYGRLSHP
jgi:allantoicase